MEEVNGLKLQFEETFKGNLIMVIMDCLSNMGFFCL